MRYLILAALLVSGSAHASFLTADAVSTTGTLNFGTQATDMIDDAVDASYVAPNPAAGNQALFVNETFSTFTFEFNATQDIDAIYFWDHYGHSAANWDISFYDDAGGTGSLISTQSFSFVQGPLHEYVAHDWSDAGIWGSIRSAR